MLSMGKIIVTAGNLQEMEYLLDAGADEVVFALEGYALSALPTIRLQDLTNVNNVSLLMNRLIFQDEIEDLKNTLEALSHLNIAHIYFADPCFIQCCEHINLSEHLIYRPETLVTNISDALWWSDVGIHGVSISPLLTKSEVMEMITKIPNCELTIHGHLLMSVSKRLLLSAYQKHSGLDHEVRKNRNLRLVEEKRPEAFMPTYEDDNSMMIYTDFIQESFLSMLDFKNCGAERFFIDGTFSDCQDIADAIRAYRQILDGKDAIEIEQEYRRCHSSLTLSTGYYGQKTIK